MADKQLLQKKRTNKKKIPTVFTWKYLFCHMPVWTIAEMSFNFIYLIRLFNVYSHRFFFPVFKTQDFGFAMKKILYEKKIIINALSLSCLMMSYYAVFFNVFPWALNKKRFKMLDVCKSSFFIQKWHKFVSSDKFARVSD